MLLRSKTSTESPNVANTVATPSNGKKMITSEEKDAPSQTSPMIYVVFASLLIDLLAFTMILPLLPSLLDYYKLNDTSGLYRAWESKVTIFQKMVGAPDKFSGVLFGGVLGSLFSFLQFLSSPLLGALSDRFGRKSILLLTMVGISLSYGIWSVATSFSVFVLYRIVGGVCKGNVSLSTAIVADVSTNENRGKGMALIGVAFALGFIFGPILGVSFSMLLSSRTDNWFLIPSLFALSLSLLNIGFVYFYFKETLPLSKRKPSVLASLSDGFDFINPSALFSFKPVQNISSHALVEMRRLGLSYFFYLLFYSGLEFTLTFLLHLRFNYTPMQQGRAFCFIGIIMASTEGGYVRRLPPGSELTTALKGICLIIPSFILVGFSTNPFLLYSGLALYSFASATVVPSLTTRVSKLASDNEKGVVMGVFRSLGSLARAIGPLLASIGFWTLGSGLCYTIGAVLFLIPFAMVWSLLKNAAEPVSKKGL